MPTPPMLNAHCVLLLLLAQAPAPPSAWRGTPPPPPPVERFERRPGFVWIDGNYELRGDRYAWVGGHYEAERPGRRWHGGHWDWQGNRYVWVRGVWVDATGFVPGPVTVQVPPPAPPPPPQVAPPPPPRPHMVWVPGSNEWREGRYVWVEGHWEKERRGERWHAGHWDRDGDRHVWHGGGWERGEEQGPPPPPVGALSIVGRVVGHRGAPLPGVTVVLAGTSEGQAVTDGNGSYSFNGLVPGSYAVRPTAPNCSFGPDVVNLNNLNRSAVQDFNAACRRR